MIDIQYKSFVWKKSDVWVNLNRTQIIYILFTPFPNVVGKNNSWLPNECVKQKSNLYEIKARSKKQSLKPPMHSWTKKKDSKVKYVCFDYYEAECVPRQLAYVNWQLSSGGTTIIRFP